MAQVWEEKPDGITAEEMLRPVASTNTSGPTAPLPDRFTVVPGGGAAGEFGQGLPTCPAAHGHAHNEDE
jgi:hypothetical protein